MNALCAMEAKRRKCADRRRTGGRMPASAALACDEVVGIAQSRQLREALLRAQAIFDGVDGIAQHIAALPRRLRPFKTLQLKLDVRARGGECIDQGAQMALAFILGGGSVIVHGCLRGVWSHERAVAAKSQARSDVALRQPDTRRTGFNRRIDFAQALRQPAQADALDAAGEHGVGGDA
jgi:hypothetical protein